MTFVSDSCCGSNGTVRINFAWATAVRLDYIVNWHVSNQISFEVSLSLKLLVN